MTEPQVSYRHCFVCGRDNPAGLQARFFDEGDLVVSEVTPCAQHRGYPGLVHGGILTALLDEAMGRVVYRRGEWAFSAKLEVWFRRHVPLGEPLRITARLRRDRGRFVEADGWVTLADGAVATEGRGLYVKLPPERVEQVWATIRAENEADG